MRERQGFNPTEEKKQPKNKSSIKTGATAIMAGAVAITAVEAISPQPGVQVEDNSNRIETTSTDAGNEKFNKDLAYYQDLIQRGRQRKINRETEKRPETTMDLTQMGLGQEMLHDFPGRNLKLTDPSVENQWLEVDAMTWQAIDEHQMTEQYDRAVDDIQFELDQYSGHVYFKDDSEFVDTENDFDFSFWVETVNDDQGDPLSQNLVASYNGVDVPILSAGPEGFKPDQANMAIRQQIQELLIPHLLVVQQS